ncbi:GAF domain-containing protein [Jannaschia formosa]|uniref:GAF domain-containing protein n=1 Tax=Jannaschia formosa TaxID=2259592 RepID=UPI000E1C16F2|nr:GAF domain-containing protein [Jannaschia formosa]TFL16322.1 GAF domain-containing protein [Jannaschia formosa]
MSFAQDLSQATTPEACLAALHAESQRVMPVRLWTVMLVDMEAGLARRAFTSHPRDYPTSGTKPIPDNDWFRQVHERRQPFVANSIAEIAAVFPDHETIAALGCASCLNLPVTVGGALAGTVNLLDGEGRFDREAVARLEDRLALPALAALTTTELLRRPAAPAPG